MLPPANAGNLEMFDRTQPRLHIITNQGDGDTERKPMVIRTPFLFT